MKLLVTFFVLIHSVLCVQESGSKELRELFQQGSENKDQAKLLFEKVGKYEGSDPLLIGYKGGAFALKAKHAANPLTKLNSIKKAQQYFSAAVTASSQNPEIRFIRYSVEAQTPARLNLSQHLTEDKNLLLIALKDHPGSGLTNETARIVRDYLVTYCTCTAQEKEFLDRLKL